MEAEAPAYTVAAIKTWADAVLSSAQQVCSSSSTQQAHVKAVGIAPTSLASSHYNLHVLGSSFPINLPPVPWQRALPEVARSLVQVTQSVALQQDTTQTALGIYIAHVCKPLVMQQLLVARGVETQRSLLPQA